MTTFVRKREAENITGLSHETLKKLRFQGDLREGIEWVRQNSRCILYNAPLLVSFIQFRHQPEQHAIAVEQYLMSLPPLNSLVFSAPARQKRINPARYHKIKNYTDEFNRYCRER